MGELSVSQCIDKCVELKKTKSVAGVTVKKDGGKGSYLYSFSI